MPLFSQDYYTGKTRLSVQGTVYSVESFPDDEDGEWSFFKLQNLRNTLSTEDPCNVATGAKYSMAGEAQPQVCVDDSYIENLVEQVITESFAEKLLHSSNYLELSLAIDSNTGRVSELKFFLNYDSKDKIVLSIKPEELLEIETILKRDLIVTLPKGAENASYLKCVTRLFWRQSDE